MGVLKTKIEKLKQRFSKKNALNMREPADEAMKNTNAVGITSADNTKPTATEYKMPIMTSVTSDKTVFKTVKVRIMKGDIETDFMLKFNDGPIYAIDVLEKIYERLNLDSAARKCFSLWVVSTELEMQLKPGSDLVDIATNWSEIMLHFTHYPEAHQVGHAINRFWFVFRREASLTKADEQNMDNNKDVVSLLYGETKRNVLTGRYICSVENVIVLGALQLSLMIGAYDPLKHTSGFLVENNVYRRLLPGRLVGHHTPQEWEHLFIQKYKDYSKLATSDLELAYVQYVREWACYGASFFPASHRRPPAGFFEFRKDKFFLGVGPSGIVVMDNSKNIYRFAEKWTDVVVTSTPDVISLKFFNKGRKRVYKVYTPQARMATNLAMRCKYLYMKDAYENRQRKNMVEAKFADVKEPLKRMSMTLQLSDESASDGGKSSPESAISREVSSHGRRNSLNTSPDAANIILASPRATTAGNDRATRRLSINPKGDILIEDDKEQDGSNEILKALEDSSKTGTMSANDFAQYFASSKPTHNGSVRQPYMRTVSHKATVSSRFTQNSSAHASPSASNDALAGPVPTIKYPPMSSSYNASSLSKTSNSRRNSVGPLASSYKRNSIIKNTAIIDETDKSNGALSNNSESESRRIMGSNGNLFPAESQNSIYTEPDFLTNTDRIQKPRKSFIVNVKEYFHDDTFERKKDAVAAPRFTMSNKTDVVEC